MDFKQGDVEDNSVSLKKKIKKVVCYFVGFIPWRFEQPWHRTLCLVEASQVSFFQFLVTDCL
jgi:hypothetical protein